MFIFFILERCSEAKLNLMETRYIILYDSSNRSYGYNIEDSGSPEHHRKAETIEKIKLNRSRKVSIETRRKISEIQKGRRLSDEWKQHISEAHKDAIRRGIFSPNIEHFSRYTTSIRKQIECFNINGILVGRYDSIQEAGRQLNLPATNICKVLKNKYKSCGGFTFRYAKEDEKE